MVEFEGFFEEEIDVLWGSRVDLLVPIFAFTIWVGYIQSVLHHVILILPLDR